VSRANSWSVHQISDFPLAEAVSKVHQVMHWPAWSFISSMSLLWQMLNLGRDSTDQTYPAMHAEMSHLVHNRAKMLIKLLPLWLSSASVSKQKVHPDMVIYFEKLEQGMVIYFEKLEQGMDEICTSLCIWGVQPGFLLVDEECIKTTEHSCSCHCPHQHLHRKWHNCCHLVWEGSSEQRRE